MGAPNFTQIPDSILIPGFFVEFQGSQEADLVSDVEPALMFAPKSAAGSATANEPIRVVTVASAKGLLGQGSFGARMVDLFRQNNALKELWVIPIADDGSGVKALWTFTVVATDDNDAGNISLYVGGQVVTVPVNADTLATTIVQDIIDQIDLLTDLPVETVAATPTAVTQVFTATNADETFHATAHGLVAGNRLTVANSGGALPAGLAAATTYLVASSGLTADAFKLTDTAGVAIAITTDGTGTQTLTWVDKYTVQVRAKNAGLLGNGIDIRFNYLGSTAGEKFPTGVTAAVAVTTAGSTDPSLTTAIAAMGDEPFDEILVPWSTATVLNALKTVLDNRWKYNQQIYGHVWTVLSDESADLLTFGATRNNKHETIFGVNDYPSPSWEILAAAGGQMALTLDDDPATPEQGIRLVGILPPKVGSVGRFTDDVRQALLDGGIATLTSVRQQAFIERSVTSYQTDENDEEDKTYMDVQTLFTLMRVARFLRRRVRAKFSRKKLANDGNRLPATANVVTPLVVKNEMIAAYNDLIAVGWVEDIGFFKSNVDVVRPTTNPNRLDILFPSDLVNQLRTTAALVQFKR